MWGALTAILVGTVTLGSLHGLTVVSWLAVEEAYRGRGLGRLLLGELEAEARRRGDPRDLGAGARAGVLQGGGVRVRATGDEREALLADCLHCRRFGGLPSAGRRQALVVTIHDK